MAPGGTQRLMLGVPAHLGYLAFGLLIGGESAGMPLPGETSLIAAGVLAAQGRLALPVVIAIAAAAAIVGDNVGYLIGRRGGGWLLSCPGPFAEHRARLLKRGEALFRRHGGLAVFLGRWLPVLRVTAAWLAGTHRMPWRRFLVWNALGGIAWAITVGLGAYLLGGLMPAASLGLGMVAIGVGGLGLGARLLQRRVRRSSATPSATGIVRTLGVEKGR